jgi:hypothetical protein
LTPRCPPSLHTTGWAGWLLGIKHNTGRLKSMGEGQQKPKSEEGPQRPRSLEDGRLGSRSGPACRPPLPGGSSLPHRSNAMMVRWVRTVFPVWTALINLPACCEGLIQPGAAPRLRSCSQSLDPRAAIDDNRLSVGTWSTYLFSGSKGCHRKPPLDAEPAATRIAALHVVGHVLPALVEPHNLGSQQNEA